MFAKLIIFFAIRVYTVLKPRVSSDASCLSVVVGLFDLMTLFRRTSFDFDRRVNIVMLCSVNSGWFKCHQLNLCNKLCTSWYRFQLYLPRHLLPLHVRMCSNEKWRYKTVCSKGHWHSISKCCIETDTSRDTSWKINKAKSSVTIATLSVDVDNNALSYLFAVRWRQKHTLYIASLEATRRSRQPTIEKCG